jgi:hypothetical protein
LGLKVLKVDKELKETQDFKEHKGLKVHKVDKELKELQVPKELKVLKEELALKVHKEEHHHLQIFLHQQLVLLTIQLMVDILDGMR